jgi:hypothetical protein
VVGGVVGCVVGCWHRNERVFAQRTEQVFGCQGLGRTGV